MYSHRDRASRGLRESRCLARRLRVRARSHPRAIPPLRRPTLLIPSAAATTIPPGRPTTPRREVTFVASYRGHLMLSAPLGAAYGVLGLLNPEWQNDWAPAVLGAGVCTLGGLLPDLDSDSGKPIRELFGITAAAFAA